MQAFAELAPNLETALSAVVHMGHICVLCMDKPGYIFAELPDTPDLREKAFACQGHGFKVCYGDGTIQVIVCRDCRNVVSLSDALNQNDDDVEAAIATSLEDPTDDELAKAIAASISDYQVARSVGASASSAAARESFEPVAGTIAPDELTNATAASIEGYPSPKTEVGKKITIVFPLQFVGR